MNKKEILNSLLKEIRKLKDKRGFLKAGLPNYGRLFGRDSLISAWQLLDYNPDIAKSTLALLSKLQGKIVDNRNEEEPGKILHEEKGHFPFNYYGSIDSTPFYLVLFYFYYKKSKDAKFVKKYWQNIKSAINWMENYGDLDNDSFLEYQRKNKKGLFHQGWKDSFRDHLKIKPPVAIVEVQGYQYLALRGTAKLADIFGKKAFSLKLRKRAKILKENFNRRFWLKKEKCFALALDGRKNQKKTITSNPGHLIFTGIVEKNKLSFLVKRLFKKDLWTPYGIRTHSLKEKDFNPRSYHLGSIWPHDNWIIAQGLIKEGFSDEYQRIKKALLRAYKEIGFLPEFYGVSLKNNLIVKNLENKPCYPQAWAVGALVNFLL